MIFSLSRSKSGVVSTGHGATLPVFIHNHTIRKVDELDSISDMSISIRDVGGALSDEKEKPFSPDLSYGAMSLSDVGGTLADYKTDPYSPTPTSGSSSASSLSSPSPAIPPTSLPQNALTRPDSTIEISSVYHLDVNERPISIAFPEPTLDVASAAPSGVRRNSPDMV